MVRSSWLGRRAGWLRGRFPGAYSRVRRVYDRLTARGRPGALSASQARALDEFIAMTPASLLKVGVLEIGSDVDGRVLSELLSRGVDRAVGINPLIDADDAARMSARLPAGSSIERLDLRDSGLAASSFGAIFSIAVFEHLLDFDACLSEMHRLLVPGGRVYAAFGPIWSSSLGHHVFADVEGVHLRHWDPERNPIEDHAHLLLGEDELRRQIARTRGDALADAAIEWIYRGDSLNRLFYEDYTAAFERSLLRVIRLTPDREHVPDKRLRDLRAKHPGFGVFDVRNAEVILERPA
jgi:SAM-dependent methyltransferase